MKCYFISGLGADERVFSRLTLHRDIEIHHLPWIQPEEGETVVHYAGRMAAGIDDPGNAALTGLSFGGIMALEIRKQLPLRKTVLLSSVKHRGELPPHLRLIGNSGIHRWVPASFLLKRQKLIDRFFGADTTDQKTLVKTIIRQADPRTVQWSIDCLLRWDTEVIPEVTHIHGTADKVFPKRYVRADHWVEGGPHFMVITHAKEVSALLNKVLLSQ